MYTYDMSKEKAPSEKLTEGWHTFKVVNVEERTSKAGNLMFVWSLMEKETRSVEEVFTVAVQGKRWFLKQALKACGVTVADGEKYTFELKDLKDKKIEGRVVYEEDKWVDREGNERKTLKSKIVEFKSGASDEEVPF